MLASLRNPLLKRFSSFVPPLSSSSSSLLQTNQWLRLKKPSHGQRSISHFSHISTAASSTQTDTSTPPNLSVRIWYSKHVSDVQAMNVIINPGLAFGSGEHPTTKLCLLLLHGLIKGGERFLDYGTGSGILGSSAVKGGFRTYSYTALLKKSGCLC